MNTITKHFYKLFYGPYDYSTHVFALHQYHAIYIAVPKVANTSIKSILTQLFPKEIRSLVDDSRGGRSVYGTHRDVLFDQSIRLFKHKISSYPEYDTFTFVRNPWDRLVSCYRDKMETGSVLEQGRRSDPSTRALRLGKEFEREMTFEQFVETVAQIPDRRANRHFRSQHTFITDRRKRLIPSFLGRFENLEDDFATAMKKIGAPDTVRLPRVRSSGSYDFRDYYTEKLRRTVAERYVNDIRLLGYSFG